MPAANPALWPVPVQLVWLIAQELQAQGVDNSELFAGFPVTLQQLGSEISVLGYTQTLAIVERGLALARRPGLGLDVGLRETPLDWGVVGYAASCSATLGEAMLLGAQYHRVGPSLDRLSVLDDPDGLTTRLTSTPPRPLGAVLPFAIEEEFAALTRAAHTLTGRDLPIREMHFSYPAPAYVARYREIFQCPLYFAATVNQIVLDRAVLATPMLQANPLSSAMATRLCQQFLARHPSESDLGMRVRHFLLEQNLQHLDEDQVARALHLSQRTLRRQLSQQGQSFQGILDSLRRQLASELLTGSTMKVADIAERLGYSDASSFRRAFKLWCGRTPQQVRAGQS